MDFCSHSLECFVLLFHLVNSYSLFRWKLKCYFFSEAFPAFPRQNPLHSFVLQWHFTQTSRLLFTILYYSGFLYVYSLLECQHCPLCAYILPKAQRHNCGSYQVLNRCLLNERMGWWLGPCSKSMNIFFISFQTNCHYCCGLNCVLHPPPPIHMLKP